jgi:hypothetical protein
MVVVRLILRPQRADKTLYMGCAERQNAAAKAAAKRHATPFQGVGAEGRKASRRARGQGSRQVRLNLALSDAEAEFFRTHADDAGMSVSYWIVAAATAFANGDVSLEARAGAGSPAQLVAEDASGQLYLADAGRGSANPASIKDPKRASGRVGCNACGRAFELDDNGSLWPHRREDPQTGALVRCPGSGQPPDSVTRS